MILQRQNAATGNDWHRIDLGHVLHRTGSYSITHTFVVPGDANIRVLVRSRRRNIPSPSNVLTYEISQAQNPNLTIQASADPISYGQSVTIIGDRRRRRESAGHARGAHRPPARVRTGRRSQRPTPPATTRSRPSRRSTAPSIEVKGAGKTSAVLYEGVKDVLTAEVSQTTIQAGQSLTFSGTVAPDHTGHVIYLERQDASGTGFHVVEVGYGDSPARPTRSCTGSMTPGTKVFRVKIPGGPENEGAASAPFTIVVTPAPLVALTPEAPGNSSLPAEGQS